MNLILQATQPVLNAWTPDSVIRVIGELLVAVLAVIGAWKGISARARTDVLDSRANALAGHTQSLDRQVTEIARTLPPPAPADTWSPPSQYPVPTVTDSTLPPNDLRTPANPAGIVGGNIDRPKGI